eukprot:g54287.t1
MSEGLWRSQAFLAIFDAGAMENQALNRDRTKEYTKDYGKRTLFVHTKTFKPHELVVNPKSFPGLVVGEILELSPSGASEVPAKGGKGRDRGTTEQPNKPQFQKLYLKVTSLDPVRGMFELSILDTIAEIFGLTARMELHVRVVQPQTISVEFLEVSFQNQFMGRSDMWRIKKLLVNKLLYTGQVTTLADEMVRVRVDELRDVRNQPMQSGLIDPGTKIIFRSRSARILLLVQLSDEMWEFADDGNLYFEKAVEFLRALLDQWRKHQTSHMVTIIFFSRTFLQVAEDQARDWGQPAEEGVHKDMRACEHRVLQEDSDGRFYQDHYKVVLDLDLGVREKRDRRESASTGTANAGAGTPSNTTSGSYTQGGVALSSRQVYWITVIKQEFNQYHRKLKWGVTDPETGLRRFPSNASDGNFMEAINCAVSVYQKHYRNRDLQRTGQNIILLSAGTGVFWVDYELGQLTKQRMVDNGIGCDLICLARQPLHIVPLFCFKHSYPSPPTAEEVARDTAGVTMEAAKKAQQDAARAPEQGGSRKRQVGRYYVPHWVAIAYYESKSVKRKRQKGGEIFVNPGDELDSDDDESIKEGYGWRGNDREYLGSCRMFNVLAPLPRLELLPTLPAGSRSPGVHLPSHPWIPFASQGKPASSRALFPAPWSTGSYSSLEPFGVHNENGYYRSGDWYNMQPMDQYGRYNPGFGTYGYGKGVMRGPGIEKGYGGYAGSGYYGQDGPGYGPTGVLPVVPCQTNEDPVWSKLALINPTNASFSAPHVPQQPRFFEGYDRDVFKRPEKYRKGNKRVVDTSGLAVETDDSLSSASAHEPAYFRITRAARALEKEESLERASSTPNFLLYAEPDEQSGSEQQMSTSSSSVALVAIPPTSFAAKQILQPDKLTTLTASYYQFSKMLSQAQKRQGCEGAPRRPKQLEKDASLPLIQLSELSPSLPDTSTDTAPLSTNDNDQPPRSQSAVTLGSTASNALLSPASHQSASSSSRQKQRRKFRFRRRSSQSESRSDSDDHKVHRQKKGASVEDSSGDETDEEEDDRADTNAVEDDNSEDQQEDSEDEDEDEEDEEEDEEDEEDEEEQRQKPSPLHIKRRRRRVLEKSAVDENKHKEELDEDEGEDDEEKEASPHKPIWDADADGGEDHAEGEDLEALDEEEDEEDDVATAPPSPARQKRRGSVDPRSAAANPVSTVLPRDSRNHPSPHRPAAAGTGRRTRQTSSPSQDARFFAKPGSAHHSKASSAPSTFVATSTCSPASSIHLSPLNATAAPSSALTSASATAASLPSPLPPPPPLSSPPSSFPVPLASPSSSFPVPLSSHPSSFPVPGSTPPLMSPTSLDVSSAGQQWLKHPSLKSRLQYSQPTKPKGAATDSASTSETQPAAPAAAPVKTTPKQVGEQKRCEGIAAQSVAEAEAPEGKSLPLASPTIQLGAQPHPKKQGKQGQITAEEGSPRRKGILRKGTSEKAAITNSRSLRFNLPEQEPSPKKEPVRPNRRNSSAMGPRKGNVVPDVDQGTQDDPLRHGEAGGSFTVSDVTQPEEEEKGSKDSTENIPTASMSFRMYDDLSGNDSNLGSKRQSNSAKRYHRVIRVMSSGGRACTPVVIEGLDYSNLDTQSATVLFSTSPTASSTVLQAAGGGAARPGLTISTSLTPLPPDVFSNRTLSSVQTEGVDWEALTSLTPKEPNPRLLNAAVAKSNGNLTGLTPGIGLASSFPASPDRRSSRVGPLKALSTAARSSSSKMDLRRSSRYNDPQADLPPVNPFKRAPVNYKQASLNHRRWAAVGGPQGVQGTPTQAYKIRVNWKTLRTPAVLPLTTDFLPPKRQLEDQDYYKYPYRVNLGRSQDSIGITSEILEDLICMRQSQDYQLILTEKDVEAAFAAMGIQDSQEKATAEALVRAVATTGRGRVGKRGGEGKRTGIERVDRKAEAVSAAAESTEPLLPQQRESGNAKRTRTLPNKKKMERTNMPRAVLAQPVMPKKRDIELWFSIFSQIQRLVYTPETEMVAVTRWVHMRRTHSEGVVRLVPYRYFLWSNALGAFVSVDRDITPNRDDFNWNQADQRIGSNQLELLTSGGMRARRIRYAILPDTLASRAGVLRLDSMSSSSSRPSSRPPSRPGSAVRRSAASSPPLFLSTPDDSVTSLMSQAFSTSFSGLTVSEESQSDMDSPAVGAGPNTPVQPPWTRKDLRSDRSLRLTVTQTYANLEPDGDTIEAWALEALNEQLERDQGPLPHARPTISIANISIPAPIYEVEDNSATRSVSVASPPSAGLSRSIKHMDVDSSGATAQVEDSLTSMQTENQVDIREGLGRHTGQSEGAPASKGNKAEMEKEGREEQEKGEPTDERKGSDIILAKSVQKQATNAESVAAKNDAGAERDTPNRGEAQANEGDFTKTKGSETSQRSLPSRSFPNHMDTQRVRSVPLTPPIVQARPTPAALFPSSEPASPALPLQSYSLPLLPEPATPPSALSAISSPTPVNIPPATAPERAQTAPSERAAKQHAVRSVSTPNIPNVSTHGLPPSFSSLPSSDGSRPRRGSIDVPRPRRASTSHTLESAASLSGADSPASSAPLGMPPAEHGPSSSGLAALSPASAARQPLLVLGGDGSKDETDKASKTLPEPKADAGAERAREAATAPEEKEEELPIGSLRGLARQQSIQRFVEFCTSFLNKTPAELGIFLRREPYKRPPPGSKSKEETGEEEPSAEDKEVGAGEAGKGSSSELQNRKKAFSSFAQMEPGFALRDVKMETLTINLTPQAGRERVGTNMRLPRMRLHYDKVFDPDACYHLEIQWLIAPAWKVQTWVQNFLRKARTAGLSNVIMVPCRESLRLSDWLYPPLTLKLPKRRHRLMAQHFLLTKLKFVVDSFRKDKDVSERLQLMHVTGIAVVRVWSGGFIWIESPMHKTQKMQKLHVQLFRRFRDLCHRLRTMDEILQGIICDAVAQAQQKKSVHSATDQSPVSQA